MLIKKWTRRTDENMFSDVVPFLKKREREREMQLLNNNSDWLIDENHLI